jgi:hypothetical protein
LKPAVILDTQIEADICVSGAQILPWWADLRLTPVIPELPPVLRDELPGEVVRLEFAMPTGDLVIHARTRQRNACPPWVSVLESDFAACDHPAGVPAVRCRRAIRNHRQLSFIFGVLLPKSAIFI